MVTISSFTKSLSISLLVTSIFYACTSCNDYVLEIKRSSRGLEVNTNMLRPDHSNIKNSITQSFLLDSLVEHENAFEFSFEDVGRFFEAAITSEGNIIIKQMNLSDQVQIKTDGSVKFTKNDKAYFVDSLFIESDSIFNYGMLVTNILECLANDTIVNAGNLILHSKSHIVCRQFVNDNQIIAQDDLYIDSQENTFNIGMISAKGTLVQRSSAADNDQIFLGAKILP